MDWPLRWYTLDNYSTKKLLMYYMLIPKCMEKATHLRSVLVEREVHLVPLLIWKSMVMICWPLCDTYLHMWDMQRERYICTKGNEITKWIADMLIDTNIFWTMTMTMVSLYEPLGYVWMEGFWEEGTGWRIYILFF